MTEMMSDVENAEPESALEGLDEQLIEELVSRARAGG